VRAFDSTLSTAAVVVGVLVALGGSALFLRPAHRFSNPSDATVTSPAQKVNPRVPVLSAREVLAAINGNRAHEHLMPLAIDARLTAAAQEKLADMLRRHYFDHQNPEGKYIWDTLARKCAYRMTAENLARGFSDEDAMEKSWMRSAPHRENILNPKYRLTGIAVSQDPLMAVVLFADTCG
jgi:uncharacterized protein YkwD